MAANDRRADLRREIREVDEQILDLVARRLALAAEIGEAKRIEGLPVRNYEVEKAVLDRARRQAAALGVPEQVAIALTRLLIDSACRTQEEGLERRAIAEGSSAGRLRMVIVGGHGRMGRWLGRFFETFGHAVAVLDSAPPAADPRYPLCESVEAAADADVIVLATPISATAPLIGRLAETATRALVFDICSLKTPVIGAIRRAEAAGLRVTSVHPMFGPGVDSLVGRNIVFCEGSDGEATNAAIGLFAGSAASLVRIPLERHDELIAVVLGLSHLTSLVFNQAIAQSGLPPQQLRAVSSTTFEAQCAVSERVAQESPDLYYEIQAENGFTPQVFAWLREALSAYTRAVEDNDPGTFRLLMEHGKRYYDEAGPGVHDRLKSRPGQRVETDGGLPAQ